MMSQQLLTIKASLQELTTLIESYSTKFGHSSLDDPADVGEIAQSYVEMLQSVKQMQSAVYGPINMVTLQFEEASLHTRDTKETLTVLVLPLGLI